MFPHTVLIDGIAGYALEDSVPEENLGFAALGGDMESDNARAGLFTHDGDIFRFTAEEVDIVVHADGQEGAESVFVAVVAQERL